MRHVYGTARVRLCMCVWCATQGGYSWWGMYRWQEMYSGDVYSGTHIPGQVRHGMPLPSSTTRGVKYKPGRTRTVDSDADWSDGGGKCDGAWKLAAHSAIHFVVIALLLIRVSTLVTELHCTVCNIRRWRAAGRAGGHV